MDGDRLTDEETALVLRRAAELDHETDADPVGLDPATLEDAAVEAGLSRQSVRRALAELRLGALAPAPAGRRTRPSRLVGPDHLGVDRAVGGPAVTVEASVRAYLEGQLFRVERDVGGRSLWCPRDDLKASIQRRIDRRVQRRLVLEDVCRIQFAVVEEPAPEGPRAHVHLEVDVSDVRRASGAMVVVGAAVGAAAVGGSLVLAGLDPVTAAVLPAGAGAALAGHRLGTSHYRQRVSRIETALQGMLDGVERRTGTPGRARSG